MRLGFAPFSEAPGAGAASGILEIFFFPVEALSLPADGVIASAIDGEGPDFLEGGGSAVFLFFNGASTVVDAEDCETMSEVWDFFFSFTTDSETAVDFVADPDFDNVASAVAVDVDFAFCAFLPEGMEGSIAEGALGGDSDRSVTLRFFVGEST